MWKIAMNSDYFLQMIPPPNKGCWPKAHNEAVRKGILMHVASEPLLGVGSDWWLELFLNNSEWWTYCFRNPPKIKQTNTPNPTFPILDLCKCKEKSPQVKSQKGCCSTAINWGWSLKHGQSSPSARAVPLPHWNQHSCHQWYQPKDMTRKKSCKTWFL